MTVYDLALESIMILPWLAFRVYALEIALYRAKWTIALIGDRIVYFAIATLGDLVTSYLIIESTDGALACVDIVIPHFAIGACDLGWQACLVDIDIG